ncbi:MAG: DinB family protein, partial [Bacteroidota bacterium]|nr:DinB family protein [Bacteroidota bacterium]
IMELKQYLIDTFQFNDHANKMILSRIKELPENKESIRFFSHLINSQIKWLERIHVYPNDPNLDWWEPAYPLEELESRWDDSLAKWINFLENNSEESLYLERKFIGFDGSVFSAPLKDIALQLNYHSIHHRAQIQTIIRQQGLQPDFIDYIATKYKKLS